MAIAGIIGATIGLLLLGNAMSAQFASQIEIALAAQARHSVRELAAVSTLGVASDDPERFNAAIENYMTEPGIAVIAIEVDGKLLVSRGAVADVRVVFQVPPDTLVRGPGYVAYWASGALGNKLAVLISTAGIDDLDALQTKISYLILAAGAVAVLGFVLVRRRSRRPQRIVATLPGDRGTSPESGGGSSHQLLQQLLAHATQGIVVVELAGQIVREHSKTIEGWFGAPMPESTLAGYLGARSVELAAQLSTGTARLLDGTVPASEALSQLPARITVDDRTFAVRYAPVPQADKPSRLLIILDDITAQLARDVAAREAREQRDVAALAALLTSNRAEFDEFFAEAAKLVASLEAPSAADAELGAIRTLKDNCAYYGLEAYVELCSSIEASLRATSAPMDDTQRVAVFDGWSRISSRLMRIAAAR